MSSRNYLRTLIFYITFSFIFYSVIYFFGGPLAYHHKKIPFYVFIPRDFPYLFLCFWVFSKFKIGLFKLIKNNYIKVLKIYFFFLFSYTLLLLLHLHRGCFNILHYEIRNFLLYTSFLLIILFFFRDIFDIYNVMDYILNLVFVLSVFGIVMRHFSNGLFSLNGRATSSFQDANVFGIVLSFCIFFLFYVKKINNLRTLLYLFVYLIAFILTNSLGAFFTFIFCLFFGTVFKINKIKYLINALIIMLMIVIISIGIKEFDKKIEYPYFDSRDGVYLLEKVNSFTKYFINKIKGVKIDEKKYIRSAWYREKRFKDFAEYYTTKIEYLFGNFTNKDYIKIPNQYLTFIFHTGFIGLISIMTLFLYILIQATKMYFNIRKTANEDTKNLLSALIVYIISISLIFLNTGNYLHTFPFNFLFFLLIGILAVLPTLETGYRNI